MTPCAAWRASARLDGHDVIVWNDPIQDVDALAARAADALGLIREFLAAAKRCRPTSSARRCHKERRQ
jgi:hypothetical protein